MANDVLEYLNALRKLATLDGRDASPLDLSEFQKGFHKISIISETININGKDFKFGDVLLLNPVMMEVHKLESKHSVLINSAENIYFFVSEEVVYVIAIQNQISKIYLSLKDRYEASIKDPSFRASYPPSLIDASSILSLKGFDAAIGNIKVHRGVDKSNAQEILINWLLGLPSKFHQAMVTLISAHVVMEKEDIDNFLDVVEKCIAARKVLNPFLIKRQEDHNGTHRILYTRAESIARKLDFFNPNNIHDDAEEATIVVDVLITGSQVIKALEFYLASNAHGSNYFTMTDDETIAFVNKLKGMKKVNVCTVLYTNAAIAKIKEFLAGVINKNIKVCVICGRDIGHDATFGSTTKICQNDKLSIKKLLQSNYDMLNLFSHLDCDAPAKKRRSLSDSQLDGSNLIARYQSLPKKCFEFLHLGLRVDNKCHPFIRVREVNEILKI